MSPSSVRSLRTYFAPSSSSVRPRPSAPATMRAIVLRPPSSADLALFGGAAAGGLQSADSPLEGGRAFVVQRDWFGAAALRGGSSTSSSTRGEESQKEHQRQLEGGREREGERETEEGGKGKRERARGGGTIPGALLSFSFYMTFWRLKAAALQSVAKEECVGRETERAGKTGMLCFLAFLGNGDVRDKFMWT